MIILYVLLVAYIIAINFYAFLLVKSLRDKDKQAEITRENRAYSSNEENSEEYPPTTQSTSKPPEKTTGKLIITGLLGGAITVYACMFAFKYKRSDLLLMVLMPLLGVLNIYLWVLLFRSGFSFFVWR
ncbi:MAG: hypothetical protein E7352_01375 [Clostridiales bacterium]|nr:hypothetical protein [Clostridiales bacterium]